MALFYFEYTNVVVLVLRKSTEMTNAPVILCNQENESVGEKKGQKKIEILMSSRLKNQSQPKQQNYHYKNVTLSPMFVFFKIKGGKNLLILPYC